MAGGHRCSSQFPSWEGLGWVGSCNPLSIPNRIRIRIEKSLLTLAATRLMGGRRSLWRGKCGFRSCKSFIPLDLLTDHEPSDPSHEESPEFVFGVLTLRRSSATRMERPAKTGLRTALHAKPPVVFSHALGHDVSTRRSGDPAYTCKARASRALHASPCRFSHALDHEPFHTPGQGTRPTPCWPGPHRALCKKPPVVFSHALDHEPFHSRVGDRPTPCRPVPSRALHAKPDDFGSRLGTMNRLAGRAGRKAPINRTPLQTLRAFETPGCREASECVRLQRRFPKAGCNSMAGRSKS